MSDRSRRRILPVAGVVVILLGFGYLLYGGIGDALVYFHTPSELHARGDAVYGMPLRLGGRVVPGTVDWNAEALDLRFRMTDGTDSLMVHATAAPPQMFRPGIGVVVEGEYTRAGVFEATRLMVKHSNEYRAPAEGHSPEEMYETLITGEGG